MTRIFAAVVLGLALLAAVAVARAETPRDPLALTRGEGEVCRGIVERNARARELAREADELWRELAGMAAHRLGVRPEQVIDVRPNERGELAFVTTTTTTTTKK